MPHFVYYLSDPLTQAVRWVGATANPSQRFWEHKIAARYGGTNKELNEWFASLLPDGPVMSIACALETRTEAERVETHMIGIYRRTGQLLNKATGPGNTGVASTSSKKARQSAWWTTSRRLASSIALSKVWTDERRAKASAQWTVERRAAHAAAIRKIRVSKYWKSR